MPRFMDFHPDLKLPDEAIAQIADDTRQSAPTSSASASSSSTTTPKARSTACSKAPTKKPSAATTPLSASPAATSTRSTPSPDPAWPSALTTRQRRWAQVAARTG